ncbi:hypothetical protein [Niameybacter massiliensis]|uniref:hypothetical protein n=1 Tax=Niameybacter massiliensis TaxID=1658108 RepID=UPI0006B49518|nr:hypothetical protein [Niameybacter massiliensis]
MAMNENVNFTPEEKITPEAPVAAPPSPTPKGFCENLSDVLTSIGDTETKLGTSLNNLSYAIQTAVATQHLSEAITLLAEFPDAVYSLVLLEYATATKLTRVCNCQACQGCGCSTRP